MMDFLMSRTGLGLLAAFVVLAPAFAAWTIASGQRIVRIDFKLAAEIAVGCFVLTVFGLVLLSAFVDVNAIFRSPLW